MHKLPSKDRDRVIKEGAAFSFLCTLVWFVGNITVSRLRTECIDLISHRNPLKISKLHRNVEITVLRNASENS